jgi:hypothetical protein
MTNDEKEAILTANDVDEGGLLPGEGGDEGDEGEGGGEVVEVSFQLTPADRRFLETAAKFLVGVQTPTRVRVVRRVGYTKHEHALGWSLYGKAAGQARPLDQYVDQVDAGDDATATVEQANRLREIDTFENLWFPRTRAIIRRVVPPEERDRFAAAFFLGLEQQPLGPLVIGSVTTFLARVEGLSSSTLKGAAEVRETLRQRGLTDAEVKRVRGLLGQVRSPAVEATSPNEGERLEAEREQRRALGALRDWFNDWATTLRPLLPLRDRIALGLSVRKRAGSGGEGDAGGEADQGGEEEDDGVA